MTNLVHLTAARAAVEAHGLDTGLQALDWLADDRSHGDEWAAGAAAEIARERWGGDVPAGDREAAVAFVAEVFERASALMAFGERLN